MSFKNELSKTHGQKYRLKCYTCFRPSSDCLCGFINELNPKTKFVLLTHPKEFKSERVGTGRMTKLQLKGSEIIMGVNFSRSERVNNIIRDYDSYLLYPGEKGINLSEKKSLKFNSQKNAIFIIDSTWSQSKKILKHSENLQKLKRLYFDELQTSQFLFKQQPYPGCLSTIESTHKLLECLNHHKIEDLKLNQFMLPFEKLVSMQIEHQNNPPAGSYRSKPHKKSAPKNKYKQGSIRKVFYEPSRKN